MDEASEAIEPALLLKSTRSRSTLGKTSSNPASAFEPLPPETRVQMKEKLKGVGRNGQALDSRGKPASAALKEFDALLAAGEAKR